MLPPLVPIHPWLSRQAGDHHLDELVSGGGASASFQHGHLYIPYIRPVL